VLVRRSGVNAPLLIAVTTSDASPAQAVAGLARALASDPEVWHVSESVASPDGELVLLVVIPQDVQVSDLVHRIRATIAPTALEPAGLQAHVGGQTAFIIDAADAVAVQLPWVIAGVVLAAGLLLPARFRAPLVATEAAVIPRPCVNGDAAACRRSQGLHSVPGYGFTVKGTAPPPAPPEVFRSVSCRSRCPMRARCRRLSGRCGWRSSTSCSRRPCGGSSRSLASMCGCG
jgi:hypothetical protein